MPPFTANCDLYAAVSDVGINLIAKHIMMQRPSLFNYATAAIAANPSFACGPVMRTPDVDKYNPDKLFTVESALPVFGADAPPVSLNYAAQLREAKLDFYPQDIVNLPAALNPPLADQHFSAEVKICAGIQCPGNDLIDMIPPGSSISPVKIADIPAQTIIPRARKLNCFCFEAFLVGHIELASVNNQNLLIGMVDGIDIVGIDPKPLEENIACYLKTTFSVLLKEKFTIPLDALFLDLSQYLQNSLVNITFVLPPNPPIPHDPAIEDNQLKAFLDLKVSP